MIIDEKEIMKARIAWGDGIISISKAFDQGGISDATLVANKVLDKLYGFEFGPILFKPTLSGGIKTFRSSKEGALSYFIGSNSKYPLDNGFGIKSWCKFESETSQIFIENNNPDMWIKFIDSIASDLPLLKSVSEDGKNVINEIHNIKKFTEKLDIFLA